MYEMLLTSQQPLSKTLLKVLLQHGILTSTGNNQDQKASKSYRWKR